jgi:kynurenine formamidase
MTNPRWKRRPDGSNWGDFGPDDQWGRLNLVTREKRLQGLAEATEGVAFCLSLPLDYPGGNALSPRRHPPILRPTLRKGQPTFNHVFSDPDGTDVLNDDLAILWLQYSTQWDSLAHVGALFDADGDGVAEQVYYNGFRAGVEIVGATDGIDAGISNAIKPNSTSSANALGIEQMATHGVQGRGVMVDLQAHYGDERKYVGYGDLMAVMDVDQVIVEPGDILCLHTGFSQHLIDMRRAPDLKVLDTLCAVLDGRDQQLLDWISRSGVAAIAADNDAVEGFPARSGLDSCCSMLPLHEHCLFKNGIHLGELWHLTPLADWLRTRRRSRFLLTAPPLRLPGAVGSPVTPIATV